MPSNSGRNRSWTPAEIEFLKDNRELTHAEVGEELGRSQSAVRIARRFYGFQFIPGEVLVSNLANKQRSEDLSDTKGPDVIHIDGSGSPCKRCWNSDGTKLRIGCFKCEERIKYHSEIETQTNGMGFFLAYDNTASRLILPKERGFRH